MGIHTLLKCTLFLLTSPPPAPPHTNPSSPDFGLARELASTSMLTGENVVGTPMYFAPEQTISGADISILTDIWAVIVPTYNLCGRGGG